MPDICKLSAPVRCSWMWVWLLIKYRWVEKCLLEIIHNAGGSRRKWVQEPPEKKDPVQRTWLRENNTTHSHNRLQNTASLWCVTTTQYTIYDDSIHNIRRLNTQYTTTQYTIYDDSIHNIQRQYTTTQYTIYDDSIHNIRLNTQYTTTQYTIYDDSIQVRSAQLTAAFEWL